MLTNESFSTHVIFISTRSLIEPIRRLLARLGGYYLEGMAEDIDFENQLVEVAGCHDSEGRKFYGNPRAIWTLAFPTQSLQV